MRLPDCSHRLSSRASSLAGIIAVCLACAAPAPAQWNPDPPCQGPNDNGVVMVNGPANVGVAATTTFNNSQISASCTYTMTVPQEHRPSASWA